MGCSSSAQTKVKEFGRQTPKSPETNGLPQCDDSLPITDKNDTESDQTKLEPLEEVKLGSSWKKTDEDLCKEEPDALIQEITKCDLSTCHRVDPEGTEPQLMAPEEKFDRSQCLSLDFLDTAGPQAVESTELASNPQVATEAAGSSPLESLQDKKPEPTETSEGAPLESSTEEIRCFVTEIVTELLMDEEEQLTEVTVPGEAGEKVESETHHEIIPGASETKEETREATLVTEINVQLAACELLCTFAGNFFVNLFQKNKLMKNDQGFWLDFMANLYGFWLDLILVHSVKIYIPV